MTTKEIRRTLESHKAIREQLDRILESLKDHDGYNKGYDISQPKSGNRYITSSVEKAAEKREKLNAEFHYLSDKLWEAVYQIEDLLCYTRTGMTRVRYDKLLRDYYVGDCSKTKLIDKYGIDYERKINAAIIKIAKEMKKEVGTNEAS